MLQTLEVGYGSQTAVVWLARPEVRNALDARLIEELTETFMTLAADDNVRAIVLAGRGKVFCAGADLTAMRASAEASEADNQADALRLTTLLHTIYTCPKPTIARLHGACMAGGLGLATACDMAIASRDTRFALTETRLGLIASTISPYVLRAIGPRAASRWFLTGEAFDAAEAWRNGLIHDVCEVEDLDTHINGMLENLLLASPNALRESKRLIQDITGQPLDAALREETARRLAQLRASEEGKEGVTAFLEKRRPAWVVAPDAQ
jgi:methylglutaconyl-CoA hydratase